MPKMAVTLVGDIAACILWSSILCAMGELLGIMQVGAAALAACVYLQMFRAVVFVGMYLSWIHALRIWHGSMMALLIGTVFGMFVGIHAFFEPSNEGVALVTETLQIVMPPVVMVACWDWIRMP